MYERLGEAALRVMELSEQEARRLGHGHVGTEHLLLGILAEGDSWAAHLLVEAGATLDGCRELTAELVGEQGRGARPPDERPLPLSDRANRSLERASRTALRRRDPSVEAGHILMNVLDVEGRAGQVLRGLAVDVPRLRRSLDNAPDSLGEPGPAGAGEGPHRLAGRDHHPGCSQCGAPLNETLVHRTIEARGDGGESMFFSVAYCGACGTAVGAARL